MAIALHHSRAKGATKLVLVGIANHDGDGGAWPSIGTLARYAACSASQVQRSIKRLEELGEIRRHIQQGGTWDMQSWARPNRYDFLLTCPEDCDRTKNHRTVRRSSIPLPTFGEQLPERAGVMPVEEIVDEAAMPVDNSTPDPPAPMRPGRTHATRPPRTHATLTIPSNQQLNTHTPTNVIARAKCGHELVDDRHCILGCKPEGDAS